MRNITVIGMVPTGTVFHKPVFAGMMWAQRRESPGCEPGPCVVRLDPSDAIAQSLGGVPCHEQST